MSDQVDEQLPTLRLPDKRLEDRVGRVLQQLSQHPSGSIVEALGTGAEAKAAYRLLSSERFRPEAVRQALCEATVARVAGEEVVLAVQDTTELNYTSHVATDGLGPLAGRGQRGLLVHSVLAVSSDGVPLGLVHQQVWARDEAQRGQRHRRRERPLEDKESFRWVQSVRAVHAALPAGTRVVHVADREADLFELFAEPRPGGAEVLIRAGRDRRLEGASARLWATVEAAPEQEQWPLQVRRARDSAERTVMLGVRWCPVTLRPPRHGVHDPGLEPVTLQALLVAEPAEAVPSGWKRVCWLLLTTLPVATAAQARECVRLYALRWLIERLHYVLKSGCGIERSQLRTAARLERLLALHTVIAWRLLWMTYLARVEPDQPATVAFTTREWQTAWALVHRDQPLPAHPPPLAQLVRCVARLGGFLARRHDGQPGVKVLWRGLIALHYAVLGTLLNLPPPGCGQ
jgi:hypothetical protein